MGCSRSCQQSLWQDGCQRTKLACDGNYGENRAGTLIRLYLKGTFLLVSSICFSYCLHLHFQSISTNNAVIESLKVVTCFKPDYTDQKKESLSSKLMSPSTNPQSDLACLTMMAPRMLLPHMQNISPRTSTFLQQYMKNSWASVLRFLLQVSSSSWDCLGHSNMHARSGAMTQVITETWDKNACPAESSQDPLPYKDSLGQHSLLDNEQLAGGAAERG